VFVGVRKLKEKYVFTSENESDEESTYIKVIKIFNFNYYIISNFSFFFYV